VTAKALKKAGHRKGAEADQSAQAQRARPLIVMSRAAPPPEICDELAAVWRPSGRNAGHTPTTISPAWCRLGDLNRGGLRGEPARVDRLHGPPVRFEADVVSAAAAAPPPINDLLGTKGPG
jgi:hypothetical protein